MADRYTELSYILPRVMDDIGINEECILRRRKTMLMEENILTLSKEDIEALHTVYCFGSKTEGTTKPGLNSDFDKLVCYNEYNIIQDAKDWLLGKSNLLMIETEHPGYCKLQVFRSDQPFPLERNVFLSNTVNVDKKWPKGSKWYTQNGPAITQEKKRYKVKLDYVLATSCKTWPKQYKRMSLCQKHKHWPTPEMIRYIEKSGCFVVPTGHRLSEEPKMEWRISTSLAERCLMFSLNSTQLRCCVLLKMIVKTFIEPHVPDVISSYICKTLLFHCIERTDLYFWRERNLLDCLNYVLQYMCATIRGMNCPNYFNKSVNLLLGKIDGIKQNILLHILRKMLKSQGMFMLQIQFDNINGRLNKYIAKTKYKLSWDENDTVRIKCFIYCLGGMLALRDKHKASIEGINELMRYARNGSLQSEASAIVFPFLCSNLATRKASESILRGTDLTPITLLLFKHSFNSDVTSSRLKYASYLYCTGKFQRTLLILKDLKQQIRDGGMQFCTGGFTHNYILNESFIKREREQRRGICTKYFAFCVTFKQAEIHCCPRELQFEMFRSTEEDMAYRDTQLDGWMDNTSIDPISYILFLQYMVYSHHGLRTQKEKALFRLISWAMINLFLPHKPTVFNLLGQCMEHETLYDAALWCYVVSLHIRQRSNAANWHIGRLFSSLINDTGTIVILNNPLHIKKLFLCVLIELQRYWKYWKEPMCNIING